MKYESSKTENFITTSTTYSCPNYAFIHNGLSDIIYKCRETFEMNKNSSHCYYDLYIKSRTKEELFNISKELQDYNIEHITFSYISDELKTHLNVIVNDSKIEVATLNYPYEYMNPEICAIRKLYSYEFIVGNKYKYIPEDGCYVTKFNC